MLALPMAAKKNLLNNRGQAVRQESWQEIESESLLLGKAVTTRRGPESWVVIRKDRR